MKASLMFEIAKELNKYNIEYTQEIEDFLAKDDASKIDQFLDEIKAGYVNNDNVLSYLKIIEAGVETLEDCRELMSVIDVSSLLKIVKISKERKDISDCVFRSFENVFSNHRDYFPQSEIVIDSVCSVINSRKKLDEDELISIANIYCDIDLHDPYRIKLLEKILLSKKNYKMISESMLFLGYFPNVLFDFNKRQLDWEENRMNNVVKCIETAVANEDLIEKYLEEKNELYVKEIEGYIKLIIKQARENSNFVIDHYRDFSFDFHGINPFLYKSMFWASKYRSLNKKEFINILSNVANISGQEEKKYMKTISKYIDQLDCEYFKNLDKYLKFEGLEKTLSIMKLFIALDNAVIEERLSEKDKENYIVAAYTYNCPSFNKELIDILEAKKVKDIGIKIINLKEFMKNYVNGEDNYSLESQWDNFRINFVKVYENEDIPLDSNIPIVKSIGERK